MIPITEFDIESVLAHRDNRNRRSTPEFHIRWAGFEEAHDSWEPSKALLHSDKLHDYLRANHMRALIHSSIFFCCVCFCCTS